MSKDSLSYNLRSKNKFKFYKFDICFLFLLHIERAARIIAAYVPVFRVSVNNFPL